MCLKKKDLQIFGLKLLTKYWAIFTHFSFENIVDRYSLGHIFIYAEYTSTLFWEMDFTVFSTLIKNVLGSKTIITLYTYQQFFLSVQNNNNIDCAFCSPLLLGLSLVTVTRRWPSVELMLGRRRRRRANNNSTLEQRLVLAGWPPQSIWRAILFLLLTSLLLCILVQ